MKFAGNQAAGKSQRFPDLPDRCLPPHSVTCLKSRNRTICRDILFAGLFDNPELEINEEVFAEVTYHAAYEPLPHPHQPV